MVVEIARRDRGGVLDCARVILVVSVLLLAACATGTPSPRAGVEASAGARSSPPMRCSAGDPDRGAWFCVIGQILYGIGTALQPDPDVRAR